MESESCLPAFVNEGKYADIQVGAAAQKSRLGAYIPDTQQSLWVCITYCLVAPAESYTNLIDDEGL